MQVSRIIHAWTARALSVALLAGIGAFAAATGVRAATPAGLYAATVPVLDGSPAGLRDAYAAALRRVLVKLTGRSAAGDDAALAARFGDPERLVQQFRRDGQTLEARFDRDILRRDLTAAGYGLLGEDRPVTLVWLGWEGAGGERGIVAATDPAGVASPGAGALRTELLQAAESRALPLRLPAAEDHALTPADIWNDATERIRTASGRYAADAVLIGRASGQGAALRWTLLLGDERIEWQGGVADGPGLLAERLADRLASGASTVQPVQLSVSGVRSADQYGLLLGYLQGLDVVERLDVVRAAGDTLGFTLQVRGGANRLERVLAARRVLQPVVSATGAVRAGGAMSLDYSLAPSP